MLTLSLSPHIHTSLTVRRCMGHVIIALLPAVAFSLFYFGIGALIVIVSAIIGCVATEWLIDKYMLGRKPSIGNLSAVLTGLLLALNLPSNLPVWTVLVGSIVAIGIGKMAFGGLGCNTFNPALVGRVFLLLSFPVLMTTWPLPEVNRLTYLDATTGPTILGALKMDPQGDMVANFDMMNKALGMSGGSIGEIGAIAILLGLVYLLCVRIISWHIPVSIIATVAVFAWACGAPVGIELLSGGLLFGAVFMATDYVTSPMSHRGMLLYGVLIGAITFIIRQWGAYPEGMSFAILIMNGFTPLINRYIKPRKFGERSVKA
ncbi:MAG: RnfABCDGE type electron transport complex subunit D [Duncaniella sp.]|nr:RnfABCDGE type electron transport complex subunit D [Duncaniella sp.]